MATYYGTAAGINTAGTLQSLGNPALNGKVKSLQCKVTVAVATPIATTDTILFGNIPPGSIILGTLAKYAAVGDTGATLTLYDGAATGTALSADFAMDAAEAAFVAGWTKAGAVVSDGNVVGVIGTANLIAAGAVEIELLYSSPQ
jgi:hypothetical protein